MILKADFTELQAERIKEIAKAEGITVSQLIRQCMLRACVKYKQDPMELYR